MLAGMSTRIGAFPQLANRKWLEDQYAAQGKSCPEIAAELGCTAGAVEYRLHQFGISVRGRHYGRWNPKLCERCGKSFTPGGPAARFCSAACRYGIRECEQCGKTYTAVPEQRKKDVTYLRKFCSFECRQAAWAQQSRDRQADPTLYRRVNANGYVEVNVGARNGGRVLEHRWVMERVLGRKLFPSEDVHHKNGDKTDNSEPNLELWTRSQPRGQRVADKIAWAIAFLEQYGHTITSP